MTVTGTDHSQEGVTADSEESTLGAGSFVEIDYTARIASEDGDQGRVIDTTDPVVAESASIADLSADGPVVAILGEDHLFDPVEDAVVEAGIGAGGSVTVDPEDAFGEVDPRDREAVDPERIPQSDRTPGERVAVAGRSGFLESIDEDAAMVNFNHPLAGVAIEYEFEVLRRVTDRQERVEAVLAMYRLDGAVDISTADDPLTLTVDPDDVDDWETRKSRAIADLSTYIDAGTIRVEETYRTTR